MLMKKAARRATKQLMRTVPRTAGRAKHIWTKVRTNALVVAGFGSIDYGIYELFGNWCWIAVGISLLLVEVLNESDDTAPEAEPVSE